MSQNNQVHAGGEITSYTVVRSKGKLAVIGSTWMVGYTPAHCSTPQGALDFAIEKEKQNLRNTQKDLAALMEMRHGRADL